MGVIPGRRDDDWAKKYDDGGGGDGGEGDGDNDSVTSSDDDEDSCFDDDYVNDDHRLRVSKERPKVPTLRWGGVSIPVVTVSKSLPTPAAVPYFSDDESDAHSEPPLDREDRIDHT